MSTPEKLDQFKAEVAKLAPDFDLDKAVDGDLEKWWAKNWPWIFFSYYPYEGKIVSVSTSIFHVFLILDRLNNWALNSYSVQLDKHTAK